MSNGSCCAPSSGRSDHVRTQNRNDQSVRRARGRLVAIPGGRFRMGYDGPLANPDEGEEPVREVEVAPFAIGPTTVTNQEFATFVKATGHRTDAERDGWSFVFDAQVSDRDAVRGRVDGAPWWVAVTGASWRAPFGPGSDAGRLSSYPVVHVSARDAEAYCAWSGTRLPSEQEWERAARGGLDGALFPWGDDPPEGRCRIFTGVFPHAPEPGRLGTLPARSLAPNAFGLHHAVGNVWEWTADAWSLPGKQETPHQRVRRGGSYLCHDSYCNRYRVAARDHSAPADTTSNIGFRVAIDASP